ncbi:MAG: hypothetical protein PVI96_06450, partial [Desulfobacterales bacterium]
MLEAKTKKAPNDEAAAGLTQLEQEIQALREVEAALHRQNEYLTALHETSLGLIDRLDKEELLEAILERAARLS